MLYISTIKWWFEQLVGQTNKKKGFAGETRYKLCAKLNKSVCVMKWF